MATAAWNTMATAAWSTAALTLKANAQNSRSVSGLRYKEVEVR